MLRLPLLCVMALMLCSTWAEEVTTDSSSEEAKQGPGTVYLLFREDCMEKFSQMDLSDSECITYSFSKLVGYLIIAGACFFKIP